MTDETLADWWTPEGHDRRQRVLAAERAEDDLLRRIWEMAEDTSDFDDFRIRFQMNFDDARIRLEKREPA